jgi:hypothetical protein
MNMQYRKDSFILLALILTMPFQSLEKAPINIFNIEKFTQLNWKKDYSIPSVFLLNGEFIESGRGYIMHKDNLGNIDSLPFKYNYGNIIFSKVDYYKFMSYNNYIGDNNINVSYKNDEDIQKIYHQFDTIQHIYNYQDDYTRFSIPLNDENISREGWHIIREYFESDSLRRVDIYFTLQKRNKKTYGYEEISFVANFPIAWIRNRKVIMNENFEHYNIIYRITTLKDNYYLISLGTTKKYFKSIENKKKENRLKKQVLRKHEKIYGKRQ